MKYLSPAAALASSVFATQSGKCHCLLNHARQCARYVRSRSLNSSSTNAGAGRKRMNGASFSNLYFPGSGS